MHTFVVRLADRPGALCGVVTEVATGEARPFADAEALLALLAATGSAGPGSGAPSDGPDSARRTTSGTDPSGVSDLTPAQLRVCRLATTGRTNEAIARTLFVSRATVESHLHAAYRKLGISGRHELAALLAVDLAA